MSWLLAIVKLISTAFNAFVLGAAYQSGKAAQSNADHAAVDAAISDSDKADAEAAQMNEAQLDQRLEQKS